ncbi:MAG: hypothetical protein D6688_07300 [Alphaproteobacteria bacterium]|nr:MAG: hypothetical protein D6688_07300 [Alphaproteobacteria bacterium]
MSLLRPELADPVRRWREAAAGLVTAAAGAWLVLGARFWIVEAAGGALLVLGAALVWLGVRRARFRGRRAAPGVVEIIEGRIAYFGPEAGGVVGLSSLERLSHDPTADAWILEAPGKPPLRIPAGAMGAEGLMDALSALPGMRSGRLVEALARDAGGKTIVIWQRPHERPRLS